MGTYAAVSAHKASPQRFDLLAASQDLARPSTGCREVFACLPRRAIASEEQRNGFSDMSAHFLPLERLKARRDQPEDLVVGQNRPDKELGGKLGVRAAQLPRAW